jgi:hypothetical protein
LISGGFKYKEVMGLRTKSYTFSSNEFELVDLGKFRSYFGVQNRSCSIIYVCIGQEGADINELNSVEIDTKGGLFETFQGIDADIWIKGTIGEYVTLLTDES